MSADRGKKPIDPKFWEALTEQRIREAQDAGEFDRLPGFGKPIPGIDDPHDENWWVRRKLEREQLSALPPALEIRRDKEQTLARLAWLRSEGEVRQTLLELNERIRKAHFSAVWGPPADTLPVDIEAEVERWRTTRPQTPDSKRSSR
jgi:hypothetical protein